MDQYPISKIPKCMPILVTISLDERSHQDDISKLEKTFKEMGFSPPDKSLSDCTKEKILEGLKKFSSQPEFLETDFMLCVIISNGVNGCFKDIRGHDVSIDEVIHIFNSENCKDMRDKPKIFIIQTDDHTITTYKAGLFSYSAKAKALIPTQADIFIYHCSLPKHLSSFPWDEDSRKKMERLNPKPGSIFIQTICDELDNKKDIEIHELSILVNSKILSYVDAINRGTFKDKKGGMPQFEISQQVQLPVCTSQLRKPFQFIVLPKETAV